MFKSRLSLSEVLSVSALSAVVAATAYAQKPIIKHITNIPSKMDMMMPSAFPLYLENQEFSSTLVLVNGSNAIVPIDVLVRDENGVTLIKKRVQLPRLSQQQLPMASLLEEAGAFSKRGSVLLVGPDTTSAAITAALSITQTTPDGPRYIDEEPAMPMKDGSSMLRAVTDAASMPPGVTFTSLSSSLQTISFSCIAPAGLVRTGTVVLPPNSSRGLSICTDDDKDDNNLPLRRNGTEDDLKIPYGITLTSDQGPGSFAAFGLSKHSEGGVGHLTSVPFNDPMMLQSSNTVFTGVPIGSVGILTAGKYSPELAVANFATKATHIRVLYYGSGEPVTLADIILGAGRSKAVDLSEVAGDPHLEDSIIVTNDSATGEVFSKLTSVGTGLLKNIEILGKDEADMFNSGQHPWSLQNGNESVLLLFNHSQKKASFEVAIDSNGVVWTKRYALSPKQTSAVDIRSLISEEVPDDKGVKLPRKAGREYGEIAWNTDGPGIAAGRLLQANVSEAMARSFSCGAYTYVCGMSTSFPGGIDLGFYGNGSVLGIDSCVSVARCSNGESTNHHASVRYQWSTIDRSIASIPGATTSRQASIYGVAVGSTTTNSRVCDSYGCCVADPAPQPVSACPSSMSVQGITTRALPDYGHPSFLTGVGILTLMTAGPSGQTYTGAVLQETVTPTAGSNTCPASIQSATSYPTVTYGTSPPFTVGSSAVWEGQGYPSVANSFYDSHKIIGPPDVLGLAGTNQCAASAGQVYSCGSSTNVVGSYLLTTTYIHGTLNGQGVTNEVTTKQ